MPSSQSPSRSGSSRASATAACEVCSHAQQPHDGCSSRCAVAETATPAEPAQTSSKPVPSYVSVSDNYAVIDVGGVQHLVEEGRWYTCNRLNVRPRSPLPPTTPARRRPTDRPSAAC